MFASGSSDALTGVHLASLQSVSFTYAGLPIVLDVLGSIQLPATQVRARPPPNF